MNRNQALICTGMIVGHIAEQYYKADESMEAVERFLLKHGLPIDMETAPELLDDIATALDEFKKYLDRSDNE